MAKKKPDEVTELRDLKGRLEELEGRLAEANERLKEAKDRAQEARSVLGMAHPSRQMLKPDEQGDNPLQPYLDAVRIAQEEASRTANEIEHVKARIAQIKRPAMLRERRDTLQETVERLERQRDDTSAGLNRLNERKEALEAALVEAEKRVSAATMEARKAVLDGREIDGMELSEAKADVERIRTEINIVRQAIEESRKAYSRLCSSLSSTSRDLRLADADVAGLELEELLRNHRDIVNRFTRAPMLLNDRIERLFRAVLDEGQ